METVRDRVHVSLQQARSLLPDLNVCDLKPWRETTSHGVFTNAARLNKLKEVV